MTRKLASKIDLRVSISPPYRAHWQVWHTPHAGSAFKQQKLPAWQPILTAGTVLPTFFLIGIAFIPIGFGLLLSSNQVKEKIINYTDCISEQYRPKKCSQVISEDIMKQCNCLINFTLDEPFERDVYIYYGLTNFYQNHRRYVRSRDDKQLLGRLTSNPSGDCYPYADVEEGGVRKVIVPCGAIANSMFNDSFTLSFMDKKRGAQAGRGTFSIIKLTYTGIAWATDKSSKFRNPPEMSIFEKYAHPPNWRRPITQLDPTNPDNNGLNNEALMVWMRTAALPSFRKLYARINHTVRDDYTSSLPKGLYQVNIAYNYPGECFIFTWLVPRLWV